MENNKLPVQGDTIVVGDLKFGDCYYITEVSDGKILGVKFEDNPKDPVQIDLNQKIHILQSLKGEFDKI